MQKHNIQSSLLAFLAMGVVVGGMYLMVRNMSLRAKDPRFESSNYIVFVEKFEDVLQPVQKGSLGFGSGEVLSQATQMLSGVLSKCRQHKVSQNEAYRFDVKVSPEERRFRVVGILTGADENPEASRCLREKINDMRFENFSKLTSAQDDAYRIVLAVQESRAAGE